MNDANEEIKQELNDLRDDSEQMYANINHDAERPDGENIEDDIDNVRLGEKRARPDNQLE